MRATTAVHAVMVAADLGSISQAGAVAIFGLMDLPRPFAQEAVNDYQDQTDGEGPGALTVERAARAWAVVERVAARLEG